MAPLGKKLQRKHGLDAIPPKSECESGAGVWWPSARACSPSGPKKSDMTEEEAITVAKRYGLPVVRIPPTGCINEILTVDLRDRRWIIVTREPPDSLPFSAKRSLP